MELEFFNALRFKLLLNEMSPDDVERVISLYLDRKRNGQYFAPHLDPIALHELSLQMTVRTASTGCRALDILADKRQAALAGVEGRVVTLVSSQ